ncbi:hypothetical protein LINPERPRIM_LOCUS33999 [Linum perenne]
MHRFYYPNLLRIRRMSPLDSDLCIVGRLGSLSEAFFAYSTFWADETFISAANFEEVGNLDVVGCLVALSEPDHITTIKGVAMKQSITISDDRPTFSCKFFSYLDYYGPSSCSSTYRNFFFVVSCKSQGQLSDFGDISNGEPHKNKGSTTKSSFVQLKGTGDVREI